MVAGRRLRASKWSAMRRLRIVCSQLRNSPTERPSNAEASALIIASAATSSTSASGSLRRARPMSVSQYPRTRTAIAGLMASGRPASRAARR